MVRLCTVRGNLNVRWIVHRTAIRLHILVVEVVILAGGWYFIYAAREEWGWW
jgi:hypothetical protein